MADTVHKYHDTGYKELFSQANGFLHAEEP